MSETAARQERPDAGLFACLYRPPLPVSPVPAPPAADQGGASPLVGIAAEFSPRYEQHRADLVSVDVRGLSRLFGSPKMIGAEMRRESAARGVRVHVALAPTRMAALVLALARPGLTVVPPEGCAEALASVPLSVLEQLHEDPLPAGSATQARLRADEARVAMAALKRWGLRTMGELAALPASDLSARLGRGGRLWQSIARGEDTRPLVPMQAEERFTGRLELEWPIEGAEPLSFVLTRLLEPLSTRLERRDRGAAVLHVELGLVTREVHVCRLDLPSPLREVRTLRTLALLDLEAHPPCAAIDSVTITIEPTPGRILQHALFVRPHPTPEQLSTLLARLGAVMGQDRIGAPVVVDSFRPGAFAMLPFPIEHKATRELQIADCRVQIGEAPTSNCQPPTSDRARPVSALRRYRQPIPARVAMDAQLRPLRVTTDRRGFAGGTVLSCAGPWRTSGAWWESVPNSEFRIQNSEMKSTPPAPGMRELFTRDGDLVTVPHMRPNSRQARRDASVDDHRSSPKPGVRTQETDADEARHLKPEARSLSMRESGPVSSTRERDPGQVSPTRERDSGPVSPKREREGGPWSRDEWEVALADGAVYRIFRDRVTDGWFIDGVVD